MNSKEAHDIEPRDEMREDGVDAEVDQPGLSDLRAVVANYLAARLPSRSSLRQDIVAGLNSAIGSTPDGMANGILAGVNPVYGLYGSAVGAFVGGFLTSTQLMVITATSAAALAANQTLANLPPGERDSTLFTMVILVGLFQALLGVLGMGRLVRFISYSVMTGFLTGIAVLMILSQIPTVTGYDPTGSKKVIQTINVIANADQVDLPTVIIAVLSIILIVTLPRTRLGNYGSLVAIIIPSILVAIFSMQSVQLVGEIPRGVPAPFLPSLSTINPSVISGAIAVAIILLVQSAGVSQSVPNPDGSRRKVSRDFLAQGVTNIAVGIFRGLPAGGSLSATALSLSAGARTRWAAVLTGVWMALIILVFPSLIAYIAMPALGALLIDAGFRTIKPVEVKSIWQTGNPSRLAIVSTFLATLFLPMEIAVGIGALLSAFLFLNQSSTDIAVVELVKQPDGRLAERKAPKTLASQHITVLDVYGHLFYAGARTLERLLPSPQGAQNPVVILRLRGRTAVGATLLNTLSNYARKLQDAEGRLYLTGISDGVYDQIVRTDKLRLTGPVQVYAATPVRGQSTDEAYADAKTWLVSLDGEGESGADSQDKKAQ